MDDYTADDLVDFILGKDFLNAKDALNTIMFDKVGSALEDMKAQVADKMFNSEPEETDD